MSMTSSTSDLPGDWTVVPPIENEVENVNGGNNIEIPSDRYDRTATLKKIEIWQTGIDAKNVKKHVGSQVQDVVEESESFNHNDSCSSSDIDIIDENENAFDDDGSVKDEPVVCPPISNINSSPDGSNATDDTPNLNTERTNGNENINEGRRCFNGYEFLDCVFNVMNRILEWNGLFQERHTNGYYCLVFIMLIFSVNTLKNTIPIKSKDDSSELHGLMKELQLENKNLKSQLMLEIQNEKLFSALEEQMKGVKLENIKLQDLLLALQKESNSEKLESQKFYKKEINQLKEQVNILQFDNEELQKQLVRMRYGSYLSPNSDDEKDEGKQKDSENLSKEVKQLRKDLESEVSKLKKLNELIEVLTKELQKSSENNESSFSDTQSSHEHKNKRSSDWSWRGVKKNIEDAVFNFQKINISDLFSHYIKNKKVYLEDAFKNIGEYFKTITQKVNSGNEWDIDIKSYLEECVNKWNKAKDWDIDVKSYLEECVNKWNKAKQEGFNRNGNTEEENKNEPEFSNSYSHKFHDSEKINLKKRGHSGKHGKFSNEKENIIIDHSEDLKKFMKDDFILPSDEENVENDLETESWMFERAAERAKLRESHEDMAINWYLKRVKDKYNNFKENFHDESHLRDTKPKKEKYDEF